MTCKLTKACPHFYICTKYFYSNIYFFHNNHYSHHPMDFQPFKTLLWGIAALIVLGSFQPLAINEDWQPLLDKDLSKWEMYLSYWHKTDYNGSTPKDENGNDIQPIGYNQNVNNVFSTMEENGEPILRISGEIYGSVFTKQEFENYHLKLKVKWGNKKWEPRLDEYMDSGILYHSQGEAGVDYWKAWMLSQELQIIEDGMGDYWCIANSQIDIRAKTGKNGDFIYDHKSPYVSFGTGDQGFCQRSKNHEKPHGDWNEIELICYGDKSLHIVNGHVVMALTNSRYAHENGSKPLTRGKIQLQSEAAEVFFKDIQIKNINSIPKVYKKYF